MNIPIAWVDAFSDSPFRGNPAAVCLLDESLDEPMDDERMQSVAFELGIAETAYVIPTGERGVFGLRWFTPSVEVDLCGHATLAAAHALRQWGVTDGKAALTFHTRSGPLGAAYEGGKIALDFPAAPPAAAPLPECMRGQWPDGVVSFSGHNDFFAFVVLATAEAVAAYVPDLPAIAATGANALLLTAAGGSSSGEPPSGASPSGAPGSGADYVLRVFGPNVGIDEDPATGSAQCAAGPWWSDTLDRPDDVLVAHQLSPRGAVLYVRPDGDRVRISGHATTVLTGHLC
jgi:predicted PhzF superfamily epimerase YddE/YHI9